MDLVSRIGRIYLECLKKDLDLNNLEYNGQEELKSILKNVITKIFKKGDGSEK